MTTALRTVRHSAPDLTRAYIEKTPKSKTLWNEASQLLPGGVTRTVAHFEPYPVAIESGHGSRLVDVDGNSYIDVLNNYTSLVHGNAHPALAIAAAEALQTGGVFPAPHRQQIRHARLLLDRLEHAERVRYANSGTEAAMLAVRLARAVTGRDRIAKAWGAYHGTYDAVWTHVGGQGKDERESERQPGVPAAVHQMTAIFDYNDPESVREIGNQYGESLAAIVVEAFLAAAGGLTATKEFLEACRDVCDRNGALLVFDEVQTLRLEYGGLQQVHGVRPDITVVGKWIGGGMPIGAIVGSKHVMDAMAPGAKRFVNHSGTFNGNVAAMSAGIVAMELLDRQAIQRINQVGRTIQDGIEAAIARTSLKGSVSGYGSLFNIHLGIDKPRTVREVSGEDTLGLDLLHLALLVEGVYAAHRGMMNVSTAFNDEDTDEVIARVGRALERIADRASAAEPS